MIYNLHKQQDNVGDQMSAVSLHFGFGEEVKTLDVCGVRHHDLSKPRAIILGGGGLLYFKNSIEYLCANKQQLLIGWGFGCNDHNTTRLSYPSCLQKFDLLGIRDWQDKYRWVPCPSCVQKGFDGVYNTRREVGVYEHKDHPLNIPGHDKLRNNNSFSSVIEFLATSDLILTNTYHGVYWSTLLNKKVVAFPFSSRFYGFRYPVPLCKKPTEWEQAAKDAVQYPDALRECREANMLYYQDVMSLLKYGA